MVIILNILFYSGECYSYKVSIKNAWRFLTWNLAYKFLRTSYERWGSLPFRNPSCLFGFFFAFFFGLFSFFFGAFFHYFIHSLLATGKSDLNGITVIGKLNSYCLIGYVIWVPNMLITSINLKKSQKFEYSGHLDFFGAKNSRWQSNFWDFS